MKAGEHICEVMDCGMTNDGKGNPAPYAVFRNEQAEEVRWVGYLGSEKAEEYAVKAALTMGFTGKDWDDFTNGLRFLDGRKVKITVVDELYKGKTYQKVQWINDVKEIKTLTAAELKGKVSSKAKFASLAKDSKNPPKKIEVDL